MTYMYRSMLLSSIVDISPSPSLKDCLKLIVCLCVPSSSHQNTVAKQMHITSKILLYYLITFNVQVKTTFPSPWNSLISCVLNFCRASLVKMELLGRQEHRYTYMNHMYSKLLLTKQRFWVNSVDWVPDHMYWNLILSVAMLSL